MEAHDIKTPKCYRRFFELGVKGLFAVGAIHGRRPFSFSTKCGAATRSRGSPSLFAGLFSSRIERSIRSEVALAIHFSSPVCKARMSQNTPYFGSFYEIRTGMGITKKVWRWMQSASNPSLGAFPV